MKTKSISETSEIYLENLHNELHLFLPSRLLRDLHQLAQKYQKEGLKLFVFGSFARGNPNPTSDLDLGVEWRGKRNPKAFLRLYWEVQQLPTIRPIDLIDFTQTGSNFRRIAGSDKIYLSEMKD